MVIWKSAIITIFFTNEEDLKEERKHFRGPGILVNSISILPI